MGMINFNTLPTENSGSFALIPKGQYIATISKAEMKQGKDTTKPPYLNVETDITDPASNSNMGKFWIIITESPADLPRWQLRRFIEALKLPIQGEFELKDLSKMVTGRKMLVDIEIKPDNQGKDRNAVDISGGCFYPIEQPSIDATIEEVFTPPVTEQAPATMSQY